MDQNQDLLTKIRRLEEKEEKTLQALNEQLENNKSLKRSMEELQKHAHDQDGKLSEANQVQERCRVSVCFYFCSHCSEGFVLSLSFLFLFFIDGERAQGRDPDDEPEAPDPGVEILHHEFGEAGVRGAAGDAAEVMI